MIPEPAGTRWLVVVSVFAFWLAVGFYASDPLGFRVALLLALATVSIASFGFCVSTRGYAFDRLTDQAQRPLAIIRNVAWAGVAGFILASLLVVVGLDVPGSVVLAPLTLLIPATLAGAWAAAIWLFTGRSPFHRKP